MNNEKLLVTNDLVFQKIFGKVGNENITKGFLEKLLGIDIKSLSLDVNKRMQGERLNDKTGRLDVKAKLNDGTTVLIEMQVVEYELMAERLLYYWAMAYTEGTARGRDYVDLNKTIAILISVENLKQTEGIQNFHTRWNIREEKETDKILTNDLEIHIIELKKFKQRKEETPVDNWIEFINLGGKEDMSKLSKYDKELAAAIEELDKLQDSPEAHEEYLWRRKELMDKISFASAAERKAIEKGRIEGEKKGLEKGRTEGKNEIIKSMYKNGMKVEEISQIVNMDEKEIQAILDK